MSHQIHKYYIIEDLQEKDLKDVFEQLKIKNQIRGKSFEFFKDIVVYIAIKKTISQIKHSQKQNLHKIETIEQVIQEFNKNIENAFDFVVKKNLLFEKVNYNKKVTQKVKLIDFLQKITIS